MTSRWNDESDDWRAPNLAAVVRVLAVAAFVALFLALWLLDMAART